MYDKYLLLNTRNTRNSVLVFCTCTLRTVHSVLFQISILTNSSGLFEIIQDIIFVLFGDVKLCNARARVRVKRTDQRRQQVGSGFLIFRIKLFSYFNVSHERRSSSSSCFLSSRRGHHHEALGRIDFGVLRDRATFSKIRIIVSRQRCAFRLIIAENRRDTLAIANLRRIAVMFKRHAAASVRIRTANHTMNVRDT